MTRADHVLAWLRPRAIPGVERVGMRDYARVLRLGDRVERCGATVVGEQLVLEGSAEARARLGRVFDVGGEHAAADARLRWAAERHGAPLLAAAIATGPIPQPGCADPHEMVYRAIIGQQIAVPRATDQLGLLASLGDVVAAGEVLSRAFPTNAAVARGAAEVLRGPRAKTETVVRVATMLDEGSLEVRHGVDTAALQRQLVAIRGIGPWTAGYIALRLGDDDALLLGDVAVQRGARLLGIGDLAAFAAACAPYRSQLMLRCWAATQPSTTR